MYRLNTMGLLLFGLLTLALISGCPTGLVDQQTTSTPTPTPTSTPETRVEIPVEVTASIEKANQAIEEARKISVSETRLEEAIDLLAQSQSLAEEGDFDSSKSNSRAAEVAAKIAVAKFAVDNAIESGAEAEELRGIMDGVLADFKAGDFDKSEREAQRTRALAMLRGLGADLSALKAGGVPEERMTRNQTTLDEAEGVYQEGRYEEAIKLVLATYAVAKTQLADLILTEAKELKIEEKTIDNALLEQNKAKEYLVNRSYYLAYLASREAINIIKEPLALARSLLLAPRLDAARKLRDEKKYVEAIEAYENIVKEGIDKEDDLKIVMEELAEVYLLNGDDVKAAEIYVRLAEKSMTPTTIKDAYLKAGELYEAKADLNSAADLYEKAYTKLIRMGVDFFEEIRFSKGRKLSMHRIPAANSYAATDQGIEAIFPQGALDEDSTFIVTIPEREELIDPGIGGQAGFKLTGVARRLEINPEIKTFALPVMVKIFYQEDEIKDFDKQNLSIYRLDEENTLWEKLESTSLDTENLVSADAGSFSSLGQSVTSLPTRTEENDLTANTPGFSIFAIMEEEPIEIASQEADEIKKLIDDLRGEISQLVDDQKSAEAGLKKDLDEIRNSMADLLLEIVTNTISPDEVDGRLSSLGGKLDQLSSQQEKLVTGLGEIKDETNEKIGLLQQSVSAAGDQLKDTKNELLTQLKDSLEPLAKVENDLTELKSRQETLQESFDKLTQLEPQLKELGESMSESGADIKDLKERTADLEDSIEAMKSQLTVDTAVVIGTPAENGEEVGGAKRAEELKKAMELYTSSKNNYDTQRYTQAERNFKALISTYPDFEIVDNALYWLGETYYAQDRYQDALRQFREVTINKFHTKDDSAQLKLGFSYHQLQDYENAIIELRKLLAEYPDSEFVDDAEFLIRLSLIKLEENGN